MSITSCILLLLCFSLHACDARQLGSINKSEKKFQLSSKNDEKTPETVQKFVLSKKMKAPNGSDNKEEHKGTKSRQKETEDSAKVETFVAVSWRVPHKKKGENDPGFMDYSPPKTHPPHHN